MIDNVPSSTDHSQFIPHIPCLFDFLIDSKLQKEVPVYSLGTMTVAGILVQTLFG